MTGPILKVIDLAVRYGPLAAIEGVSFELEAGETLGIVGESGSGKSTVAQAILRLNEGPSAARLSGAITYGAHDILGMAPEALWALRGREIAMIFQDPMSSLNPVMQVGAQIAEAIEVHGERADSDRIVAALSEVGLPDPARVAQRFPHELSGGMQQRVMIAMALVMKPRILLADEPTTALDVTVQAQILDLLVRLRDERGMSVIFITHDLGALAQIADRVMVMYAGSVVECGPAEQVYRSPAMPYTVDLLAATPSPGARERPLRAISEMQPAPGSRPDGCLYAPRCRHAVGQCSATRPPLALRIPGHVARCHFQPSELALRTEAAQ